MNIIIVFIEGTSNKITQVSMGTLLLQVISLENVFKYQVYTNYSPSKGALNIQTDFDTIVGHAMA